MLIYFSQNKVESLLKELEVTATFFESICRFGLDQMEIGGTNGIISGKLKLSNRKREATYDIKSILRSLKAKGKLIELSPNAPIRRLTYISSKGTMEYLKYENGFTASRLSEDDLNRVRKHGGFFEDDFLYFRLNIGHQQYDKIIVKCTANNIEVFGCENLQFIYPDLFKSQVLMMHRNSADPGILFQKIDVEFIVSIHDTNQNDKSIIGSPIVIYSA